MATDQFHSQESDKTAEARAERRQREAGMVRYASFEEFFDAYLGFQALASASRRGQSLVPPSRVAKLAILHEIVGRWPWKLERTPKLKESRLNLLKAWWRKQVNPTAARLADFAKSELVPFPYLLTLGTGVEALINIRTRRFVYFNQSPELTTDPAVADPQTAVGVKQLSRATALELKNVIRFDHEIYPVLHPLADAVYERAAELAGPLCLYASEVYGVERLKKSVRQPRVLQQEEFFCGHLVVIPVRLPQFREMVKGEMVEGQLSSKNVASLDELRKGQAGLYICSLYAAHSPVSKALQRKFLEGLRFANLPAKIKVLAYPVTLDGMRITKAYNLRRSADPNKEEAGHHSLEVEPAPYVGTVGDLLIRLAGTNVRRA